MFEEDGLRIVSIQEEFSEDPDFIFMEHDDLDEDDENEKFEEIDFNQ